MLALDVLRNRIRKRCKRFKRHRQYWPPGEHGHDSHRLALHNEGVAGEGGYSLILRPGFVTNSWIVKYIVRHMRSLLFCDDTDLQLPNRHAAVGAIKMG